MSGDLCFVLAALRTGTLPEARGATPQPASCGEFVRVSLQAFCKIWRHKPLFCFLLTIYYRVV